MTSANRMGLAAYEAEGAGRSIHSGDYDFSYESD